MHPRGVSFNPTSLPELRVQRTHLHQCARVSQRPSVSARLPKWNLRRSSTQAGENKTGHISAGPNEGILFFDNLFPIKLPWVLRFPMRFSESLPDLLARFNNEKFGLMEPIALVKRAIPSNVPIKVTEILPRLKDGGAFVKFSHDATLTPQQVEQALRNHLKENPIKPWFNPFRRIKTNLVRGRPWLEDLARTPSTLLKVEFVPAVAGGEAVELSQETLFTLFRRYGKLADITAQPSDSKVLPRYALIDFARLRNSVMAQNCMHGFKVAEELGGGKAGTQLRLSFERKMQSHMIHDWIFNHPRIVIPAVAAVVAGITVAIFDPIRTFFIRAHIEHSFHLADNRVYRWFKNQALDIFALRQNSQEDVSLSALWDDRKTVVEDIQGWLMESDNTFIIVQGPRGSGKKELIINNALKERRNVLVLDCKPIQEAHGESAVIRATAQQVGYRPVFSWMNSISSLIDLGVQSTTGVKSGFSETLDSQLGKILQNTAIALRRIALSTRDTKKDTTLADDDYLETHPERLPVVVVDNFGSKKSDSIIFDKISEWAAGLTAANIAHVIFLTDDATHTKPLEKALPNEVFHQVALGDITRNVAKKFVLSHLDDYNTEASTDDKLSMIQRRDDVRDLDDCIDVLGGRVIDLEYLARRLQTGQKPKDAVEEIVTQAASEIIKVFLMDNDSTGKWSPEQAWYLIRHLASHQYLKINDVLLQNTFSSSLNRNVSSGETALDSLSHAELITINTANGRPVSISAGRPVFRAAFQRLVADRVLKSRLDYAILKELSSIELKAIDKCEAELSLLAQLPRQPAEIVPRITFLLRKLQASQAKVETWDKEMTTLKKYLAENY